MQRIADFYSSRGWKVVMTFFADAELLAKFGNSRHVYIWNGSDRYSRDAVAKAESSGARVFCVEHGHFPQKGFIQCAEGGLYGRHPGRLVNWDAALSNADWERMLAARQAQQHFRQPIRDVLVPLQVRDDVTMLLYSNGYCNADMVAMELGPDKWIRHHPKNAYRFTQFPRVDDRPNLLAVLGCYDRCVGINSTVLLQAALMGLEVKAFGQSYLDWSRDRDTAVAAVMAMQIPTNASDLSPWIRTHMGLQQLEEV
jgi:hypothetical protein